MANSSTLSEQALFTAALSPAPGTWALLLSSLFAAGCAVDDRAPNVGGADASVAPVRPDPEAPDGSPGEAPGNPSPACAANASECLSSTHVRRCTGAGVWAEPEECEFACAGGDCGGACKPSVTRCASAVAVETCSPEGQWGAPTPCTSGCSGQACAGECEPGTRRCHPETGIPQLCGAGGSYEDEAPCGAGAVCTATGGEASCTCQNELTACGAGCFDLDTDPDHCGACDHGCQGSACSGGRCTPTPIVSEQVVVSRMALNATQLFFTTTEGDLYRVNKDGAGLRALALGSNLRGVAVDGTTVYWGEDGTPGEIIRSPQSESEGSSTFTSSPDGLGGYAYRFLVEFAEAGGPIRTDALAVSDGFVYWVSGGYRRAPTTATLPATGELLGEAMGSSDTTSLMAPAGPCVYGVDTSLAGIVRACTGGAQAGVYSGNLIMDLVADASGVYFSEHSIGIKHIPLDSDEPTITTLAPTAAVPLSVATDQDFVYFIDGGLQADLCAPDMAIRRVPKGGGAVTTLVQFGSSSCPKVLSVDDTFLYFAAWDDPGTSGAISRVAK